MGRVVVANNGTLDGVALATCEPEGLSAGGSAALLQGRQPEGAVAG